MNTLIVSAIFLTLSSGARAAVPLLSYDFGNQAHESTLQILDDGTVVHKERSLLEIKTLPESPLSEAELSELTAQIQAISKPGSPNMKYEDLSFGMEFGGLSVFSNSKMLKVRTIEEPDNTGRVPVFFSSEKAARKKIEALVNQYVRTQLPRFDD